MPNDEAAFEQKGQALIDFLKQGNIAEATSSPENEPMFWEIRGFTSAEDARLNLEQGDFDERLLAAFSDPILTAYHQHKKLGDSKTLDPVIGDHIGEYTDEALKSELQSEYALGTEEANLVFAASKSAVMRRKEVE